MAKRSMVSGVLIGFLFSLFLTWFGLLGSLIVGFVAGFYVGGGPGRGLMAAAGVWFLHLIALSLLLSYIGSSFLGWLGGLSFGLGTTTLLSFNSILDLVIYGVAGAVGGLLNR
jgi:hypothetical protein